MGNNHGWQWLIKNTGYYIMTGTCIILGIWLAMVNNGKIVNATEFCSWRLLFYRQWWLVAKRWSITVEKPAITNFLRGDRTINNSCSWWCQMCRNRWRWLGWLKPPGSHGDPQFGIKIWLDTMHILVNSSTSPKNWGNYLQPSSYFTRPMHSQYLNIHQSPERSLVEFDSSFYSSWAAHEFVPPPRKNMHFATVAFFSDWGVH